MEAQPGLPLAFIDRTLFARALTNVIENALHAMPGGGSLTLRAFATEAVDAPDAAHAASLPSR